jgi:hypothetical protein
MKRTTLTVSILLMMSNPAVVLAEELAVTDKSSEVIVSDVEASTSEGTGTSQSMRGMGLMHKGKGQGGMMHGGGQHGKGQGGMMHGGGQHGKGQGGMMRGGGRHGKGGHEKDRQVVQRLDMIEARMAKIEAMLEILVRR